MRGGFKPEWIPIAARVNLTGKWLVDRSLCYGGKKSQRPWQFISCDYRCAWTDPPISFFDMDELALLISGSTIGEVYYLAQRAGLYSLVFLVSLAIVILVFFHLHEKINLNRQINLGLIVLSVIEFFVIYLFAGQPGFFGDRLFVIMEDQVVPVIIDGYSLDERKEVIYSALTEKADLSQASLRTMLEKRHIEYTPYYLVNALEVDAGWLLKTRSPGLKGLTGCWKAPGFDRYRNPWSRLKEMYWLLNLVPCGTWK